MKMMYVLTTGEYSNYRILCACSTKAIAEKYASRCKEDVNIEEYPLDVFGENAEYDQYLVRINRDGDVREIRKEEIDGNVGWCWKNADGGYGISVAAMSTQHALKTAKSEIDKYLSKTQKEGNE